MATDPTRQVPGEPAGFADCDDKDDLTAKAERCRRLAAGISDRQAAEVLNNMARNYQDAANRLGEAG